jgi:glycogen debranching enzyme
MPYPAISLTASSPADESFHVCHKGYISLFPFLLGLLPPDSPHLGAILDIVRDPDQLWSPYGIRSLSKQDPHFGQGENYWRGPIWIQMNYLALSALHNVGFLLYCLHPSNWLRSTLPGLRQRTGIESNASSGNLL